MKAARLRVLAEREMHVQSAQSSSMVPRAAPTEAAAAASAHRNATRSAASYDMPMCYVLAVLARLSVAVPGHWRCGG